MHLSIWLILWICIDMLFFSMSVCNTCAMTDSNPENNVCKVRLRPVSQSASVGREKVRTRITRPLVYDNPFDGSKP